MATETLRPNAPGDECTLPRQVGAACPNHYQNVDEGGGGDGDTSYVESSADEVYHRDLYHLQPSGVGAGTINHVTVYAVIVRSAQLYETIAYIAIKSGGVANNQSIGVPAIFWTLYSRQWATPPEGGSWDWDKIDALQAGISLAGDTPFKDPEYTRCTQVYVVVDYEPAPDPPTNVQATDGVHSDKVVVTWTKSAGATGYQVYRDDTPLGWLGDVDTYNDTGAGAPSITPGDAVAGDGGSTAHVALSISGEGTNNGTTHTYKVRARTDGAESGDSDTDTGYRAPGALTYQWQRSSGDSDADYGNIAGTTEAYNDTGAPAPTVTPGTASASDGTSSVYVTLSLAGESANIGAGRFYRCVLDASGCIQQTTGVNRGYRGVGALTLQWQRSAGDSDAAYGNIGGATTDPYNDTGAPGNGQGRYYQCVGSATGATPQTSSSDRGYRWMGEKTAHMGAKLI